MNKDTTSPPKPPKSNFSISMDPETKRAVAKLAEATGRSFSAQLQRLAEAALESGHDAVE